jgi:hypothetical protein
VSRVLDCVSCEKCKLHGKLSLLGLGTALKILLVPENMLALSREEVVALINTLEKFSRAIQYNSLLRDLYEDTVVAGASAIASASATPTLASSAVPKPTSGSPPASSSSSPFATAPAHQVGGNGGVAPQSQGERQQQRQLQWELGMSDTLPPAGVPVLPLWASGVVDEAVALIDSLARGGQLTQDEEDGLIDSVVLGNPALFALVKHYHSRPAQFLHHARRTLPVLRRAPVILGGVAGGGVAVAPTPAAAVGNAASIVHPAATVPLPAASGQAAGAADGVVDCVIIGSGLAGLSAAVSLFDQGASVVIVEKEAFLGGNSVKVQEPPACVHSVCAPDSPCLNVMYGVCA